MRYGGNTHMRSSSPESEYFAAAITADCGRTRHVRAGVVAIGLAALVHAATFSTSVNAQCLGFWSTEGDWFRESVFAVTTSPGGRIVVGGAFANIVVRGVTTNRILYYDSARQGWNTLGTGVNDDVYATAILPGGDIVAGGFFTTAGGISTSCIARYKYNTRVWSAMGAGTDDFVSCLAVLPDGDLVAGGNFSFANNTLVNHIARYRPSTGAWSALGAGTNDYVASLAITPDGDLIVGGLFSSAGGIATVGVARYKPTSGTWSALGSGIPGYVAAVAALPNGDVIAGGLFTSAGSTPANNIARFNVASGTWVPMSSGTNGQVLALTVLPDGDVVAGGAFTTAGGLPVKRVARFNPSTSLWVGTAGGPNDTVYAVAPNSLGNIYVGGAFTMAASPANGSFVHYIFERPAVVITGQPQPTTTCLRGNTSFTVSGLNAQYAWYKGATRIDPSVNPSALTPTLVLTNVGPADVATYKCALFSSNYRCQTVWSSAATLSICTADFNCDGFLTFEDFDSFVNAFDSGANIADFNSDGFLTFEDFDGFVGAIELGC